MVLTAVVAYALLFSILQIRLYDGFIMGLRDLAFYEQAFDNTLQGRPYIVRVGYVPNTAVSHLINNSWAERSLFTEHTFFLLMLLLPPYALFQTPYVIFIFQAVVIALAAIPLFLFARRRLADEWLAAGIAIIYLLYPAGQIATVSQYIYGHHPGNLAPFCLFALLYFAEIRRARGFWLMSALALATTETIAPAVAAIGLTLALTQRGWRRHGIALMVVASLTFLVATLVVIPLAGGGQPPYYFAALKTLWAAKDHPELLAPIGQATLELAGGLLLPLALLPLLGGIAWLIMLPELFSGFIALTVGYGIALELGSWHIWPYVVAAFVALAQAFTRMKRWFGVTTTRFAVLCVLLISLFSLVFFGPYPFSRDVWPQVYAGDERKAAFVAQVKAEIPFDASLSTEFFVGSHFAARSNVYWFPVGWQRTQYVLVDAGAWAWWSADDARALADVRRSRNYDIVKEQDTVVLFKRKATPPMEHDVKLSFVNGLELRGFNLEPATVKPGDRLNLTLYWRANQIVRLNLTVFNHIVNASGKTIVQKDNEPDNGAYRTTDWPIGETVIDRYQIKMPDTVPAGASTLEVGLYSQQNGERVTTTDGADKIVLATITVQ